MPRFRSIHLFALTLGALLVVVWCVYLPGLHGGFLFDDFANLPALGASGPVDTWPIFWRYITSSPADPIGRPLSLLSFLLDATDWPADPFPFLRTSLVLHLLNGALLALLLRRLGHALRPTPPAVPTRDRFDIGLRIDLAAVLGAALWLLHPLLVSTTLYIVQREAILPATFTLLGLLLWLHGRTALLQGRMCRGLIWMTIGLGGCTLLGVLSKANGILLPALALVVEYTVLQSTATRTHVYRRAMLVFGWLPTALVAGYLVDQGWNGFTRGISALRPWTLGQRLLTEPRVLMDYLALLWLPRPFTPGLFNDQIHASTSLWSPATTLPALLAVIGLIVGACWLRRHRRWPALALAVLFYFVGQSLESSTVAIELYFEHRNYLPAMLMFWPLALWLCGVQQAARISVAPAVWSKAKAALAVVLILGLALMTHARAELWGNPHDQALLWAKLNPASPRAQASAAQTEMSAGHPALAATRLQSSLANAPDQVQLALNLFAAQCQAGHVSASTMDASVTALHTTRNPGALLIHWFERAIAQTHDPLCPELTLVNIDRLLDAAQTNPRLNAISGRRQDMDYLQGRVALARGDGNGALADFNRALDQQVRITAALKQAALLGSMGYPRQGLAHLDHWQGEREREAKPGFGMPRVHAWVLHRQHYWQKELARLRATLREDAARQTARPQ